ncbi:putative reverse transcriptase domain-containing protein, partial [Tanacetum coccineum]
NQQQNRTQETVKAYAAALADGKVYAGRLPKCNRCSLHHHGQCPPECRRCQRTGHLEEDCRAGLPGAGVVPLQDVICFRCGEKGHFKNRCPKGMNQLNKGSCGRAYVVVKNPQQNPNVVTVTALPLKSPFYHEPLIANEVVGKHPILAGAQTVKVLRYEAWMGAALDIWMMDSVLSRLFDANVTSKCGEEDKVKFAASTFEGRALTWWNGNVHTLGLENANNIPWNEFKTMMTRLFPATRSKDGRKRLKSTFGDFRMESKEMLPLQDQTTLHDAINMARELVEQAVQSKAARVGESNKRKWEAMLQHDMPPECRRCQRTGHLEEDCRVVLLGTGAVPLHDEKYRNRHELSNSYTSGKGEASELASPSFMPHILYLEAFKASLQTSNPLLSSFKAFFQA